MEPLYKFAHIGEDNEISRIYVFGIDEADAHIEDIFSPSELRIIREKSIRITYFESFVYQDDTIEVIKEKLLQFCGLNCSFDELYLFAQQKTHLNALSVYKTLTQNEKLDLTRERLVQFLLNLESLDKESLHIESLDVDTPFDIDKLVDKPLYTYDDILALNLENMDALIFFPIGQKFTILDKDIQYTVNPFSVIEYDSFLERNAQDITSTTNKVVLMNTGNGVIVNNMIYICLAEDVLRYTLSKGLSQESTIKIYFPYLFEKSILGLNQLEERKPELLANNETLLTAGFDKRNEIINVFYSIFRDKQDELSYVEQGTRDIEFIIYPEVAFNLPLDIVFKLIHASRNVPLIKYNPAKKQDKLYRLFTDKIATNGKKIPYLDKSVIFRLAKTIGKTKRVAVYIEYRDKGVINPIVCNFESNGNIHVNANFSKTHSFERLNHMLKEAINPIIDVVRLYLSQNGYNMNLFSGLNDKFVEIVNMDYIISTPINKQLKIKNIMGCVSTVFSVVNDDIKTGIVMRFKRVTNYNEMDSIDAFITEMVNRNTTHEEIIELLISNFNLTPKKAQTKLADFINSLQVVQDAFQHRTLKIKNNPGFLTTIHQGQFNKNIIVTITGINNVNYLRTIPMYIDSFIRLTQQQDSDIKQIDKLCKTKSETEKVHIEDIVSASERLIGENKQMNIVAQELVFENIGDETIDDDMYDILFGEDDEDVLSGEDDEGVLSGEEVDVLSGEEVDVLSGGGNLSGGGRPKKNVEVAKHSEETVDVDITGKRLTHPNPFHDRISKRDPNLFVTYKEDNFKDYSRSCPWTNRRHPVILTDEEKEKIDKEHPGSYAKESAVKYGSDTDKQFWYICPRYWSLKDNTSLTDEEVASGNYGKVIPHDGKQVKKGEAIFEFNDDVYHKGKKGEYVNLHPGFLKPSTQGRCLPCCVKSWDSAEQKTRRDVCAVEKEPSVKEKEPSLLEEKEKEPSLLEEKEKESLSLLEEEEEPLMEKEPSLSAKEKEPSIKGKKKTLTDDYIKGSDKFPLEHNRYGYLPLAVQMFLMTDNRKCQISISNANLKPDHICMVRRGIEFSKTQSFIACISDIYTGMNNLPQQSIAKFKETLINAMDIDTFISLQNGNLITIFAQDGLVDVGNTVVNLGDFKKNALYKSLNKKKEVFIKIAHAYNNFKEYLSDSSIEIDYNYLWDLICQPNNKLFKKGLNLAIVEMTNNDITNNVSIVCPTNHYASTFFDDYKSTVIIIKHSKQFDNKTYNLYEPVYAVEDTKKEFIVTYGFKLDSLINIRETIELIKRSYGKCGAYPSVPNVYEFKRNISLQKMVDILDIKSFVVEKQIMNYNGKVIGILVKNSKRKLKGFLPCFPSAFIKHLDTGFIWMDDEYSDTYPNTMTFLNHIYKEFNGRIPCKPKIKVVEDGLIVGIITETNQFIMVAPPLPDTDTLGNDLIKNENMGIIGLENNLVPGVDKERVTYINNIRIESKIYNVFRNTARILLGQMRYKTIKNDLEAILDQTNILYLTKLKKVEDLLHGLMLNSIEFSSFEPSLLEDISNCNTLNKKQCASNKFCMEKGDGSCALIIPKVNLISGLDNEVVYFGKLADELIRYNRIKSFIIQQNTFLSFTNVKYNLSDNEIILLQSLLTNEYFEGLTIAPINSYIKYNSYDTAQPIKTQKYSNVVMASEEQAPAGMKEQAPPGMKEQAPAGMEQKKEQKKELKCTEPSSILVTSPYWKQIFPEDSIEIIFNDNPPLCTFDILIFILKNTNLTKYDLKEILVDNYLHYYTTYKFEIIQIFKLQGKHKMAKQLLLRKTTLSNIIMSEDYYATNLDLWILIRHFKIPVIFISSTELVENGKKFLVANRNTTANGSYYFIKSPGIKNDVANVYRLIASPIYEIKIPLSALSPEFVRDANQANQANQENVIEDYLKKVSLMESTQRLRNKKVNLIVEGE